MSSVTTCGSCTPAAKGLFRLHKPNSLSVMSYSWVFRTGWPDNLRLERATCCRSITHSRARRRCLGSRFPPVVNTIVDYSEGMARPLIRPSFGGGFRVCLRLDNRLEIVKPPGANTLEDFANWRALVFNGPAMNGGIKP